ncbi:MAG: DUF4397 domain-containing protein [Chloroflexi bacterium]|nr:DUF4397 domain-containing protein [Chloroflexota bacterium]
MRKAGVLLIVLLLLAAVVSTLAQEATAEPTAEATQDANQTNQQVDQETIITRVRFANLSPDAPTLMVYADGQLTSVQQLPFPSVSGWVEFTGSPSLMLAEPGATSMNDALVGPFTVPSNTWTTVAVVGSKEAGTLTAVSVNENVTAIPEGCARVTVFHAIEGGPAVTLTDDQGNTLIAGLGFPGAGNAGGSASSSFAGCVGVEATPEAGTDAAQVVDTTPDGALQCTTLVMADVASNTQAEATVEATTEAADNNQQTGTDQQRMGTFTGSRFGNCGFTFDVPAGTYNFQAGSAGAAADGLGSTGSTELAPNTYYFVAVVGTPDNPQTLVVSFGEAEVSSLFDTTQTTNQTTQGGTEPVATPEATLEATPEATPGT